MTEQTPETPSTPLTAEESDALNILFGYLPYGLPPGKFKTVQDVIDALTAYVPSVRSAASRFVDEADAHRALRNDVEAMRRVLGLNA